MRQSNTTFNRRGFLKVTGGALAASVWAGGCAPQSGQESESATAGRTVIPVGTQLYCVRHEMAQDVAGTIARVAELGYQGVEFADYFGKTAAELRQMLDDNGLKACGTHIFMDEMTGDLFEPTVEFNATLGNPYLIVRSLREDQHDSKDAVLRTCEAFNALAENLRPHGMRVGYHCHGYSFDLMDGEMMWNILADHTSPEVILQMDTGNAAADGVDVVDTLRRNAGRSQTIHIKPYHPDNAQAYLGDDALDWPTILELCETSGATEWYIIEYEVEGIPPLQALGDNLRKFEAMNA